MPGNSQTNLENTDDVLKHIMDPNVAPSEFLGLIEPEVSPTDMYNNDEVLTTVSSPENTPKDTKTDDEFGKSLLNRVPTPLPILVRSESGTYYTENARYYWECKTFREIVSHFKSWQEMFTKLTTQKPFVENFIKNKIKWESYSNWGKNKRSNTKKKMTQILTKESTQFDTKYQLRYFRTILRA